VHLRPPSFDHGVVSFIWALALALFIWIFQLGIGYGGARAFILSLLAFGAIFLFVRLRGDDSPGG
jgi:hypothetical protein